MKDINVKDEAFDELPPDMTPLFCDNTYPTRILLIRHGESLANAERVFLGHTNLGLSPRGYAQAEATAEYLRNEPISAIYSSDLIRAYDTALANARLRGLPVEASSALREIYIGKWENQKIADIERDWGEVFTVGWKKNFGVFTPPMGEAVVAAGERFYNAVTEIARKNAGKCVLIAAHAAVLRSFYSKVRGLPPERMAEEVPFPENASVTTVYFDGERLIPGEFSHAAHLRGI